jgi:hydrogenase maturation protease
LDRYGGGRRVRHVPVSEIDAGYVPVSETELNVTTMRVLVAGVGNIFLGDDGFGSEVARRLCAEPLPAGVRIEDFGIRSLHLAYELLEGYDLTVLIDALSCGRRPGTLYVFQPDFDAANASPAPDAHSLTPETVFGAVRALGGTPGRVLIVGCEPGSVEEGMGLSAQVNAAAGEAVHLVRDLLARECAKGESDVPGDSRTNRAGAA